MADGHLEGRSTKPGEWAAYQSHDHNGASSGPDILQGTGQRPIDLLPKPAAFTPHPSETEIDDRLARERQLGLWRGSLEHPPPQSREDDHVARDAQPVERTVVDPSLASAQQVVGWRCLPVPRHQVGIGQGDVASELWLDKA
jgi:hypothetical protein